MTARPAKPIEEPRAFRALPCELLVVDDEEFVREAISLYLASEGCRVHTAANGLEALERVEEHPIEAAIIDIRMPKMDGLTLLSELKSRHPDIEVLMSTGFQSLETAVEAMRRGACDYITKPITDLENDLLRFVVRAIERRRLRLSKRRLAHGLQHALDQLGGVRGEWQRHLAALDGLEAFGRRSLAARSLDDLFDATVALLPSVADFEGATLHFGGNPETAIVRVLGSVSESQDFPVAVPDVDSARWIEMVGAGTGSPSVVAFPLSYPTAKEGDPVPGWIIVHPFREKPLRVVDRLVLRSFADQLIHSIAAHRGRLPRTDEPGSDAVEAEKPSQDSLDRTTPLG